MKFLIVGANFRNKGAQSMLMITMDALRSRFPDCDLYMITDKADARYRLEYLYADDYAYDYALGGAASVKARVMGGAKIIAKRLAGKATAREHLTGLKALCRELSGIVDISGFCLSSQFSLKRNQQYLRNIRLARAYGIPFFAMPQSFGPFEYGDRQAVMDRAIAESLPYAQVLYAREREGYDLLTERYGLKNVRLSTDLVLQNRGISLNHVFHAEAPLESLPQVEGPAVGIVPNQKCLVHGNHGELLAAYRGVIEHLRGRGYSVHVLRHSTEDLALCRDIKDLFPSDEGVFLWDQEISCLGFEAVVGQFDFLIASRYHSVVHAYRRAVPCIVVGWATKYQSLMGLADQGRFANGVQGIRAEQMIEQTKDMSLHRDAQSERIRLAVIEAQRDDCFDCIGEHL